MTDKVVQSGLPVGIDLLRLTCCSARSKSIPPTLPPRRKSIRLKDYDYSQPGGYFVTTATQDRCFLFGNFDHHQLFLNAAGSMIDHGWQEIPHKYPSMSIDAFVVMPDHFHGVVILGETSSAFVLGQSLRTAPILRIAPTTTAYPANPTTAFPAASPPTPPQITRRVSLPEIVQWFKTMTTNAYIHGVKELDWQPFPGKLWQRNYYEHVVRNHDELDRIRLYINENPRKWLDDLNNPIQS